MSILGSILSSIFGKRAAAQPAASDTVSTSTAGTVAGSASASPANAPPQAAVDVAALLDTLARKSKEKDLEWRKSIVDLMKLLSLDSSLGARKKLAQELHYTGDMKKTAQLNVWLHKQAMSKVAENGGIVPKEPRD